MSEEQGRITEVVGITPKGYAELYRGKAVRLTQALRDVRAALEAEVQPGLSAPQMVAEFRLRMDQAVVATIRAESAWGEVDE